MEEMSPAVALTVSLANPVCETSRISSCTMMLDDNSCSSWDSNYDCGSSEINTRHVGENSRLSNDVPESEDDEVLSVGEDPNLGSVELLPLDSSSDLAVPLNTDSEASLPIAVEIAGIDSNQIVAKVISLEERSIKRRLSEDKAVAKPGEECSGKPAIKASVVSLKLSSEKDLCKGGGVKSVFELDCLPLWGSVSICGLRPEMEDAVMTVPNFMKIPIKMFVGDRGVDGISQTLTHLTSHFFGVYDGHGGSQVANYCQDRIHLALIDEIKDIKDPWASSFGQFAEPATKAPVNGGRNYNGPKVAKLMNGSTRDTRLVQWESIFTSCFQKIDNEVSGKVKRDISEGDPSVCSSTSEPLAPETVGSTAVVAVVCSSHIIVANCGDSRAVLYRGKEAIALSVDHKPNREDEYARIEASGGKVIQWNGHRVFGVLAMSRSIGDRYLKPWIIPEPEVMFMPRAREDECLVFASDGLWDVISNEEACELARKQILIWHKRNGANTPLADRGQGVDPAAQAAAEYLSNLALRKGSRDNISVIVVDLKAQRKFKNKS